MDELRPLRLPYRGNRGFSVFDRLNISGCFFELVINVIKWEYRIMDSLYDKYPNSKLEASGLAVGLPEGQMGNSEVGHMNIGAGRIVYQDLVKLNNAVADDSIAKNTTLLEAFEYAKTNNKPVHFTGLVSDGGIHSHINHLKALCIGATNAGLENVFIHAFTGSVSPPAWPRRSTTRTARM